MKYNILIIGFGCYNRHILEFVANLKKKNPQVEITVAITHDPSVPIDEVNNALRHNARNIIFYKKRDSSKWGRLAMGLYYYYHFLLLWIKGGFDIVDIHYVIRPIKFFMPIIKRMTRNIVITPWGSDVLRVEEDKIKDLKAIYSDAKYITTSIDSILGNNIIKRFDVSPEKMVNLWWGGEFFDYIQEHSNSITTEEAKGRFGLNGRYVITCGYNTQKQQRHEDIINAIYKVKDQLPSNLTLLFPFTYGRTQTVDIYIKSLESKCREMGLDYIKIVDRLDMADLLKLRMATDIFVHVQVTDAGSRCVSEYVLCNKKVIHGTWMNYSYLEDNKPTCFFPVERMEELSDCIIKAYHTKIDELPQKVRDVIMERSWGFVMNKWNAFFESLVQ